MFDNTVKNVVSIGLLFSLCAPYSFASAQNGSRNIPTRWSYLSAMQQAQLQPSALEQLWQALLNSLQENFATSQMVLPNGCQLNSAVDLSLAVCAANSEPVTAARNLINICTSAGVPFERAQDLVRYAIHDIYEMDDDAYRSFLSQYYMRFMRIPEYRLTEVVEIFFEEYKSKYPN